MTSVATSNPVSGTPMPAKDELPPTHRRGRLITVCVMIASLLVSGVLQDVVARRHNELIQNTGSTATLSNLNSFSLALLLGGLRGPLVMMLWMTSENQKHDKDLEDFDTKIELIRLLQPEFDSVHLFQIWNKAYNVSVQMANLPNKYTTILDAVDYAHNVDQSHPNDINIVASFGNLFFDKLGNSAEKFYYADRVRRETQWREPDHVRPGEPGWRRTKLDPLLDAAGNILPAQFKETAPRPANLPPTASWNTGAPLQYLKKYEPWPYGIPPMAIGYNYFKQAQVLQEVSHQRHLQLSDLVMDNRPAISLRLWAEIEANDAIWCELRAFGVAPAKRPLERVDLEQPTSSTPLTAVPLDPALVREAIYHYDLITRLSDDGAAEYHRHLAKYLVMVNNFRSHLDSVEALKLQSEADRDYLKALIAPADQRAALAGKARAEYIAAVRMWEIVILSYYLPDAVHDKVFPRGFDQAKLQELSAEQIDKIMGGAERLLIAGHDADYKFGERREYHVYIQRCHNRVAQLGN